MRVLTHFHGWKFYLFLLQWVSRRAEVGIKALLCFNYILWVQMYVRKSPFISKEKNVLKALSLVLEN